MRRGLVLIGGVLVVLGLLVVTVGLINLPSPTHINASGPLKITYVAGSGDSVANLSAPVGISSGTISVDFTTTGGSLTLYLMSSSASCAQFNPPPGGSCVLASTSPCAASGTLSYGGASSFPYVLDLVNCAKTASTISGGVLISGQSGSAGIPVWEITVLLGGGSVLAIIGGISAFLGVFLKGNVYGERPMPEILPEAEEGPEEEGGSASSGTSEGTEGSEKAPAKPAPSPKPAGSEAPAADEKALW